jgi:hypothetical protein
LAEVVVEPDTTGLRTLGEHGGRLVGPDPTALWPSGLPDRKGKILFLAPRRALAFADDPA